ncbi:hypothetical protein PV05_03296 [Exophiala xenobiotica]|uniref:Protein kinase domain-containing protein n=1 Tax=Exophiala xenobiotica TaxID=348802 RepID=A0A0D2FFA3_9EURO|nr:uncharacterized protein PV05_03296 [Exophiala xenobiotica]KIW58799.1 hypothetical protein PV05_03296 [Exophiala xenobiotica]
MADSRELDSAWIIISCSESHADDISRLEANKNHIIVYEDLPLDGRDTTPFGDEQRVYFGLRPRKEPSYLFGTGDNVSFQLTEAGAGRRLRVSNAQFCLKFNHHKSWMLVDLSTNGTWVEQDLVVSARARHCALSTGHAIQSQYDRLALHPEKWNLITAGKIQFQIKMGKARPSSYVADDGKHDLDLLHLQFNPISMTPSVPMRPAFVDQVASWKFHRTNSYTSGTSSRTKLLVRKSTGQRVIGKVYDKKESDAAQRRYDALFEILSAGSEKNLIPFLESVEENGHTIISEYFVARPLNELIEKELTPYPFELSFIFAQINRAVTHLHSKGIIHGNIRPEVILVARGSPFTSRLTGFSEAIWTGSGTEVIGHHDYRAPEMNGCQNYDQLVDVFSLSKVMQHCLAIHDASDTLMDSTVQKGLAVDPVKRHRASQIQEEIDSTADGDYTWPFEPVKLKRRFTVAWYHEYNDTYIRLSDLYPLLQSLADPYRAKAISPIVKPRYIDDPNFPGEYCKLVYGENLFVACGVGYSSGILKPQNKKQGVFSGYVDLNFEVFYHIASQMFNVTTLLRTVPLELARVATWDIEPQIQEVHGDKYWEGNYIDRPSFEKVLERVQQTTKTGVLLDHITLDDQRAHTRFATVDYSKAVIVVTKWASPPWVTLSREKAKKSFDGNHFGSKDDLQEWCATYGLQSVLDRVNLTIGHHPIPRDWKIAPRLALPPLGDDDMTSILSSHSSTAFRWKR